MKQPDPLFLLIKSMNKSEKGYFIKFAPGHSSTKDNNYLSLFHSINNQTSNGSQYCEDKIIKQFKNEKFIHQLHVLKNYLYKKILKSLADYHNESSIEAKLNLLLTEIDVTFNMALYRQCEKLIYCAKELAKKYERFYVLGQILEKERFLIFKFNRYYKVRESIINNINNDISENNKNILNLTQYEILYDKLRIFSIKFGSIRNMKDIKEFKEISENPLLKNENKTITKRAKYFFYYINAKCDEINFQMSKCIQNQRSLINLLEKEKWLLESSPLRYYDALYNYIYFLFGINDLKNFKKQFSKLDSFCKTSLFIKASPDMQYDALTNNLLLELMYYYEEKDYKNGKRIISEINNQIAKGHDKLRKSRIVFFYYIIAKFYLKFSEHNNALKFLNLILNDSSLSMENEIVCNSRIINILLHYEMGNLTLVESLINSTLRFFSHRKNLFLSEEIIIHFLKELLSEDEKNEPYIFHKLEIKLEQVMKDILELNFLEEIGIFDWMKRNKKLN